MGDVRPALLTDKDRELLEFLAEHRTLVALQIAELLRVQEATALRRIRRLQDLGLAGTRRILDKQSPAVWITRGGLQVIGRSLPPPRRSLQQLRHDVGLGWLWLAARDGAFGSLEQIVSEREMRSHDGRPDGAAKRYGVGVWHVAGRGPGADFHYPDLMLKTTSGHRVAVELELSSKADHRLEEIMYGYSIDRRYDRVLYLVENRKLGERIRRAARTAGVEDLVRVQRLAPATIAGVPVAPAAERSQTTVLSSSRLRSAAAGARERRSRPQQRGAAEMTR